MKKLAFVFPFLGMIFASCENDVKEDANVEKNNSDRQRTTNLLPTQDLLWNSNGTMGVSYRNFLHLNLHSNGDPNNTQNAIEYLSNLYGLIPNKPSNIEPDSYGVDNFNDGNYDGQLDGTISAIDGSTPSLKLISLGYDNNKFGQFPGFDIGVSGGYNSTIEFNINNNSRLMDNPNNLRELGLLFEHWPGPQIYNGNVFFNEGKWAFKNNYRLGDFSEIQASFYSKLNYRNNTLATSPNQLYATADFRFAYFNSLGEKIREDLLGVIFYMGSNYDLNGNPSDEIYWQDFTTPVNDVLSKRILLKAGWRTNLSPLSYINTINTLGFNLVKINYKQLISTYLIPPDGYSINDAVITGFDIYSSTKGYDVGFSVKNVRLIGVGN